ncbi:MAG: ATP-binding cassette domain-containing protein, partial [Chitinophagaceae bacterium]|nr:ATP-binding cassette domain-containing protein [Rubrivivax sp.]
MTLPPRSPAHGRAPLLQAVGLAGQRGERPLFRGLDISLVPGCIVWLRGRNGRGKTSLLRLLAGLSSPASGQVLVDGQPLHANPAKRARMTYIAHTNALKDDLTVNEALQFLARLQGQPAPAADIAAALAQLGLASRGH